MKLGVKIWSTNDNLIRIARKHFDAGDFDFLELSAIIGTFDDQLIPYLDGIPTVIHCDNQGVNFADKFMDKRNIKALKTGKLFADSLNSDTIIIHPGYDGSLGNSIDFIRKHHDSRICVENLPAKSEDLKFDCVGRTYDELINFPVDKYCVDFSHAIKAACSLGMDWKILVRDLLKLKPELFHSCDGFLNEVDEHLGIGEGEFDYDEILSMIRDSDNLMMTIEVKKKNFINLDYDIENIGRMKNLLNQRVHPTP